MATKKKLAKALRELVNNVGREQTSPITRVQTRNGKRYILKLKKGVAEIMHLTNPYRVAKRAYNRGQMSMDNKAKLAIILERNRRSIIGTLKLD